MNFTQIPAESVLMSLPYGVMVLTFDGEAVFVNDKFTELTGYLNKDFLNITFVDIIDLLMDNKDKTQHEVRECFGQVCKGVRFSSNVMLFHKNGGFVPVELKLYVQKECDSNFVMLVCHTQYDQIIQRIWSLINSSLEIEHILQNTTTTVVECLGLSSTAIFLFDKKNQELRLVACNVFENKDLDKVVYKIGQGPPGIIAGQLKPLYIADLHEDELSVEFVRTRHDHKSSIGYPLMYKDQLLGVIAFDAKSVREFSDTEKILFEIIAEQVALAIDHAKLVFKLEHLSVSDGLTGLYNHRYFQEKLTEEVGLANLSQTHLSLLLMDMDNFKVFNDTFGHPKGDELLKCFANIIKANVRGEDIVCRYGGEEFAVILKGCRKSEALLIADRIRLACEQQDFVGCESIKVQMTVSLGVASYPEARNSNELILAADNALYKAKVTKNCVEC